MTNIGRSFVAAPKNGTARGPKNSVLFIMCFDGSANIARVADSIFGACLSLNSIYNCVKYFQGKRELAELISVDNNVNT
jgi:hypothetical protein